MKKTTLLAIIILFTNIASAQWVKNSGPTNNSTNSLAVIGTTIFAGTDDGIFISSDNGISWTKPSSAAFWPIPVYSFAVSGTNIYAGTLTGVFLSTDNGTSWTELTTGGQGTSSVVSLAVSGLNIYAAAWGGLYLSTNNGTTWTNITGSTVTSMLVIGSTLYAGSNLGVYKTTNNGTTWTAANTGLTNHNVLSLISKGTDIFAGTTDGVYLSSNSGASWTAVNSGLYSATSVTNVHSFLLNGINLFAGTCRGVYLSSNSGASWTMLNTGLINYHVLSLALNDATIFAGTDGAYGGRVYTRPLSQVVGVEEIEKFAFNLAPNPVSTETTITFKDEQKNSTIIIIDVLGKEVKTLSFTGKQLLLDMGEMKKGVYFIRIIDENKKLSTKKIVLQ